MLSATTTLEQILTAIEQTGSLSRTARQLECSAPTLRKCIARAEVALGTTLIATGSRGCRLTEGGTRYLRTRRTRRPAR